MWWSSGGVYSLLVDRGTSTCWPMVCQRGSRLQAGAWLFWACVWPATQVRGAQLLWKPLTGQPCSESLPAFQAYLWGWEEPGCAWKPLFGWPCSKKFPAGLSCCQREPDCARKWEPVCSQKSLSARPCSEKLPAVWAHHWVQGWGLAMHNSLSLDGPVLTSCLQSGPTIGSRGSLVFYRGLSLLGPAPRSCLLSATQWKRLTQGLWIGPYSLNNSSSCILSSRATWDEITLQSAILILNVHILKTSLN